MSDSNSDAVPIPRQGFVLEELDGETLLYRHSLKKLIYLNASAASVWKLCDGKRSAREIAGILADAYPEEADTVTTDVSDAIDGLIREGALRIADQPAEIQPDRVDDSAAPQVASGSER
jgi:Coenzyme PQQ synthesis protein D (PqqD)